MLLPFDIESAPIDGADQYLEPASAPANYKDPEKIKQYIADAQGKALANAATDIDLARIVCIGWRNGDTIVHLAHNEREEATLLRDFWCAFGEVATFVGHNILAFDLPLLLRRSLYLGVPAPKLQLGKYRHDRVIDLMLLLNHDGLLPMRSKDFYARRLGIVNPDKTTGADVPGMVARGDWAAVAYHCQCDVDVEVAIAERIGVLEGVAF